MPARAHWKGYLKLSLVSCPISLFPAIASAERVSFRQVNRQTGNRLRQQLIDSVTGQVVDRYDTARGYEIGENRHLIVEDEELEAARTESLRRPAPPAPSRVQPAEARPMAVDIPPARALLNEIRRPEQPPAPARETPRRPAARVEAPVEPESEELPPPRPRLENPRTIEIERFVPLPELDPRYFDTPYYIAPRDPIGEEAFAVIREAMRGREVAGLGRVMLSKRLRPILVSPLGDGLQGMTLRHAHEVRPAEEYFAEIPSLEIPGELLAIAEHIVAAKSGAFDPSLLEDHYRAALVGMLKAKHTALPAKPTRVVPTAENVVNLMELLNRSLEAERPAHEPLPPRRPKARGVKPSKRAAILALPKRGRTSKGERERRPQ
jgi:DNA end-binding protein Ku